MSLLAHRRTPFGAHVLHRLGTETTSISFVPAAAGYIHQVELAGRDVLLNYVDDGALATNDGYRNLALVPFPNRLLEGSYTWLGKQRRFPVNVPDTRSALHGFGLDAVFQLDRVELGNTQATAHLSFLHRATSSPAAYPFTVHFKLALTVDVERALVTWSLTASNMSNVAAPVGLGWHPYFNLPGQLADWSLEMPANDRVVLREAIPTGERAVGLPPKRATPIDPSWDDCFALVDSGDRTVQLIGPEYGLALDQGGQTRYTQLFVPPERTSVAIEPMTCNVDAFNQARREVALEPGQSLSTSMSISLLGDTDASRAATT